MGCVCGRVLSTYIVCAVCCVCLVYCVFVVCVHTTHTANNTHNAQYSPHTHNSRRFYKRRLGVGKDSNDAHFRCVKFSIQRIASRSRFFVME